MLLTGASGFAGTHLGRLLRASGADVVELACDVRRAGEVAKEVAAAHPVAIAHLAGLSSVGDSWQHEQETWEVNALGTLNVVLATIQAAPEARVLLASSAEVYGDSDDETALTEARAVSPISPYGRSKAAAEIAGLRADLDVVVTRAFPHAGPGQSERFAIPAFAHQIARIERGDAPPVLKVGNLAARRDISDVRCVADAYSRLLAVRGGPRIVNIASGVDYEIADVVRRLGGPRARSDLGRDRRESPTAGRHSSPPRRREVADGNHRLATGQTARRDAARRARRRNTRVGVGAQ